MESTITAKLQQDPSSTRFRVRCSVRVGRGAVGQNAGSTAQVVTLDTNAALVDAIKKNGDVQWAVDQQPFLQGYLSVDSLWLYLNNGNVIGGGQPTLTGPSFIDQSNIDAVADLAKSGTR